MATDPKHHALLIAMGVAPKQSSPTPPPSVLNTLKRPAPQSQGPSSTPQTPQMPQQGGQKVSGDDAGWVSGDQRCGGCTNFTKETGDCSKVEGMKAPDDTCKNYYEAANPQAESGEDMNIAIGMPGAGNGGSAGGVGGGLT